MRIAIIRKKYTFHGGAEGFSQNLITQLADASHEVHIYAVKWEGSSSSKNIFFHKVPTITLNSTLRDLSFAISSFFLLREQREYFDIIQSHDKTFYQDIYRAGDGCHREWLKQRWKRTDILGRLSIILNPYHWLILVFEHMIFKGHRYKKILAISEMVKRNIVENYGVLPADIEVIYNGVNIEKFCPENRGEYKSEIRRQYGLSDSDFVILFVGSGFERKGVEFLLKAVELVSKPITVLIAGKGSETRFKNLIKRQRVIFCGPQKEIHKYYAAADIFLFTAIYEPFGNVHLEALASGLPVITTKQSGASEIIENGKHGFAVEKPENIEEMAEKVIYLMDKNVNQRMSVEARKLAETFSFETHIKKMIELYNTIRRESESL